VSARVRWAGLEELREALRNLPADLAGEAGHIVEGAANGAGVDLRAAYQERARTGHLAAGVTVTHYEKGRFSAGAIVKNRAKHAWLFENGTQARHTDLGANRGAMPPGHVFVPIVMRARRGMYEALKVMLERHGLKVSGDA